MKETVLSVLAAIRKFTCFIPKQKRESVQDDFFPR